MYTVIHELQLVQKRSRSQCPHVIEKYKSYLCPGGGTLGILGWGCATGTLESLAYTRVQVNFATLY